MTIETFSRRLLNPFRGVINVIRYNSAEAMTMDGVNWDIYVGNDVLLTGLPEAEHCQTGNILYGSWSKDQGLHRGPIISSYDLTRLESMGEIVYRALLEKHDQVPFELSDPFELWLIDTNDKPLALIHSVCHEQEIELDMPTQWRAGNHCQKMFTPELDVKIGEDMTAAEMLMLHIHMLAGYPVRARWYFRDNLANGIHLASVNTNEAVGQDLPACAFAPYFINENSENEEFCTLLRAYTDWQAPWLLLLPSLSRDQRKHFEKQACQQALMVDAQYRLYPDVIREEEINGARVEAMMRKRQPKKNDEETILSAWYLELAENRQNW